MLQAKRSVAASFRWKATTIIALFLRGATCDLPAPRRSRRKRLPTVFLCVVFGALLTCEPLLVSTSSSPTSATSSILSMPITPSVTGIATEDKNAHPSVSVFAVSTHIEEDPPSTGTAHKGFREVGLTGASEGVHVSADREAEAGSSAELIARSSAHAQLGLDRSGISPTHRLATTAVNGTDEYTATNAAGFAPERTAPRWRVSDAGTLSAPAEIELRERLQHVRRQQQKVRQHLEELLLRRADLSPMANPGSKTTQARDDGNISSEFTSQHSDALVTPENGTGSSARFVQLQINHVSTDSGDHEFNSSAHSKQGESENLLTIENVNKRLRTLQKVQRDLKAEEKELQRELDELTQRKAEQDSSHQTLDRALRAFHSRFERQLPEDSTTPSSSEMSLAPRRRSRRRRSRRRRLEREPAYLQLTGGTHGSVDSAGAGQIEIRDTVNEGLVDDEVDDGTEAGASGDEKKSSRDEELQTEGSTLSLENRLGHAVPVVPHDRQSAGTQSDATTDVNRPRQTAAPVGLRQHDSGTLLLEVDGKNSETLNAEGLRRRRHNRTPSVQKSSAGSKTSSRMKPEALDQSVHGSTQHRKERVKKRPRGVQNVPSHGGPSPLRPTSSTRGPPPEKPREKGPVHSEGDAGTGERRLRTTVRHSAIRSHDQKALPTSSKPPKTPVAQRRIETPSDSRRGRSEVRTTAESVKARGGRERPRLDKERFGAGASPEARQQNVAREPLKASSAAVPEKAAAARAAAASQRAKKRSELRRRVGALGTQIVSQGKNLDLMSARAAAKPMLHYLTSRLGAGESTSSESDNASEEDVDLSDWDEDSLDGDDNNEEVDMEDGEPAPLSNSKVDEEDTADEGDHADETESEEAKAEEDAEDDEEDEQAGGWSAVEVLARHPHVHLHVAGSSSGTHSGGSHGSSKFEYEPDEGALWQSSEQVEGYEENGEPGEYEGTWDDTENAEPGGHGGTWDHTVNGMPGEYEGSLYGTGNEYSGGGDSDVNGWDGYEQPAGYDEAFSPPSTIVESNGIRPHPLYMEPKIHRHRTFENFGKLDEKLGRPDWIKQASTSANADDVRWDPREKLQIYTQEDVYKQAHDTIAGLDYLGAGYDILRGNPLGDPETSVDPGFRDPVLRFYWTHNTYGVTNDLSLLQPVGGFVRPFVSCRRSETADEMSSMSDYQNELSVDAKVEGGAPFVSFSAGTSYKQMAKEIAKKDEKNFLLRTYCFRYEAGLATAPQIHWNTTYGFERALLDLSTSFHGLDPGNGCPPSVYKITPTSDACKEAGVTGWMSLFEQYGTHVTNNVKLGGKIVHSIRIKKQSLDTLKDKGVSVSAAVSAQTLFFSAGASTSTSTSSSNRDANSTEDRKVTTYIIGGRPPKDPTDPAMLVLWSKTVEDLPMPIQIKLQPLSVYMPAEFREAYSKALLYYGRAFGMSQAELDRIFRTQATTVAERLRAGHSVVWGGAAPGYVECPGEELVVLGLAIVYNFRDLEAQPSQYHVTACEAGRHRCDGPASPGLPGDEARIWAVCAPTEIVSLRNVVVESVEHEEDKDLELRCPLGMEVMVGVKLAAGYGPRGALESYIDHCATGKEACTMPPRPPHNRAQTRRFIYAACLESTYPGLRSVHAISSVGDVGEANNQRKNDDGSVVLNCGPGQVVLFGWTLENHTRAEDVRNKFVNCTPGQQMCLMKGAGVNKAPSVGAERRFTDVHALLGYCLCVLSSSYNNHPAAHSTAINGTRDAVPYILLNEVFAFAQQLYGTDSISS